MRVVELELLGHPGAVLVSSITKTLHPGLRAGDRKDQPMIDPSRRWLTGNDDFLSRTELWRRQPRSIDLRSIAPSARRPRCRGYSGGLPNDLNLPPPANAPLVVVSNKRPGRGAPAA